MEIEDATQNQLEDDHEKYRMLYTSNAKSITSFQVKDIEEQRTESFREQLDHNEFKKYLELNKKNYKQPSITQKFFNRKELFTSKKNGANSKKSNHGNNHLKNSRLSKKQVEKLQREDLNLRKEELKQKAYERKMKLDRDNFLKINREQMMTNVCQIIFKHIEAAQKFIEKPTEAALLFHENNFIRHEWIIQSTGGYSSTMPLFLYVLEDIEYVEKPAAEGDLILFMRKILDKMQLATECIIISLIYLEKMMINGGLEIRYCNWRPLIFTAILLASKFWEDIKYDRFTY